MFDWPAKLEPSAIHTVSAFEPSRRPMAMQSMLCAIAWARTADSTWERAELVRMLLVRLILKRVRVHGIERESVLGGDLPQGSVVTRRVPWKMRRYRRRCPHQMVDGSAVLQLVEQMARLAGAWKPCKAGATCADAPGRDRDAERH